MGSKKEILAKMAFYSAFILVLFVDYVSATSIPVIYSGRMFQLAILLLLLKVILTKYSKAEWAACILLLGVGVISFFHVKNYFFLLLVLLIFAAKAISFRRIIAVYLIFTGILTVTVGTAAFFGWFGEMSQTADFRMQGVIETRYCMGYTHPNTYHIVLLQLLLTAVWFYWEKLKWYHLAAAIMINFGIFMATDSRTNLILGTGILGLLLLGKVIRGLSACKWLYTAGFLTLAGSLLLSFLTVVAGTRIALLEKIDRFWSGRILWGHAWANNYLYYEEGIGHSSSPREQITLFSSESSQMQIDMGFIKLYYNYGIVIFIGIIAFLAVKLLQNAKKKDWAELMILITGTVWMLGEVFSFGEFITRNILFLFMLNMLWQAEKKPEVNTVSS